MESLYLFGQIAQGPALFKQGAPLDKFKDNNKKNHPSNHAISCKWTTLFIVFEDRAQPG